MMAGAVLAWDLWCMPVPYYREYCPMGEVAEKVAAYAALNRCLP